jgi:outer membrane protein, heavy metal efflux system
MTSGHPALLATESGIPRPEPQLTESSSLHDVLAYAAEHSPQLEAAFHQWRAAAEREAQAGALPDPRLVYRYYVERVETRTGAQRQSFGVEQRFPWFGTLTHRSQAASHAAGAAQRRYEAAFLELAYRVKAAWYESYYVERAIDVARTNLRLLKQFEGVVRARYRAAASSQESLLRLQVELGQLDDLVRSLEDARVTIRARLNAALGREADAATPSVSSIPDERIVASDAELMAWAREGSLELEARDYDIRAEEERVKEARKRQYPDVTVGLTLIDTADQPGAGPHPREDGHDPVIAGISVNLPIWGGKYSAGVREARARHRAARSARAQDQVRLDADIREALTALHGASRRAGLYGDSLIPQARQSLKATEAAFRAASVGFGELIDAQRTLLEFELVRERARADRAKRVAELEMLVGRPVSVAPLAPADGAPSPSQPGSGRRDP